MLRRGVRRASRYLQISVAVLSGAAQKHHLFRQHSRRYRRLERRVELAANTLFYAQEKKLSPRQHFFSQQQLTRKVRAARLLEARSRLVHSVYRAKANRTGTKFVHAARRLGRKLKARRNLSTVIKCPAHRSAALLQRQTALRTSR